MSGTSLDGLDIALCRFEGSGNDTSITLLQFDTIPYTTDIKTKIKTVFAQPLVDFQYLCLLNEWIGALHGELVLQCLESWQINPAAVDIIASHGQTVMHTPKHYHDYEEFEHGTLQIGDGDHIAVKTGIITLSDFRQKHIAAGGEGAPLAVYGDYLLFSKKGENRIMLNLGGIGNFTYLPSDASAAQIIVSDTGPSNTLMDQFVQQHYNIPFDKDSMLASKGTVNQALLTALKAHAFFKLPFPKTTGPELFNLDFLAQAQNKSNTLHLSNEAILATLNRFSAETIAEAILSNVDISKAQSLAIYFSGGGAHNPLLLATLQECLPNANFYPLSTLGINGDAKEAILFAALANESLVGGNVNFEGIGRPSVSMGKISFPK